MLQHRPRRALASAGVPQQSESVLDFGHERQAMAGENFLDGIAVLFGEAACYEVCVRWTVGPLVALDQLGNDFIRTAVIEHDNLREVEHGNAKRAQLADLAFDTHAQRLPGRARHEMRVQARHRARHERRKIERDRNHVTGLIHRHFLQGG